MPPSLSPKLLVEYLPVASLVPSKTNARTHSKRQISQIAASIQRFGFNNPILADRENVVRAGHGRLEAAKLCGMATVPVIRLEHMTANDFRTYALADNRLAEEAGWDHEVLAIELQELQILEPDLDLTLTGFEVGEIDLIIQNHSVQPQTEAEPEPDPAAPLVSQVGDLWLLGDHRILCGNSTEGLVFRALMQGEVADAVFIDPPYNVPISGHVSGKGKVQHREFAMASGEMSDAEFSSFLRTFTSLLALYSKTGSLHFVCMDWRHVLQLLEVGREFYELKNICVWVKDNGGMAKKHKAQNVLIEDKVSGTQLIQELGKELFSTVTAYKPPPGTDKIMRLHAQTDLFENGLVFLPKEAPWLAEYILELTGFPGTRYDDQVDSTSQALDHMRIPTGLEIWEMLGRQA